MTFFLKITWNSYIYKSEYNLAIYYVQHVTIKQWMYNKTKATNWPDLKYPN